jgi:hypothetical protein
MKKSFFYTNLIGGICVTILGLLAIKFDWNHLHGFPTPKVSNYLMVAFGLIMVILTLKKKGKLEDDNIYVICKNCKSIFLTDESPKLICPNCNFKLEELEGFYDRHPELK